MSADMECKSGIAATHVGPIAATARDVNAFILIRKTNLRKLFAHWRGKGGSSFGLAPVAKGMVPTVDKSRITGQGSAQPAAAGILDRIRNALTGHAPLQGE